MAKDKLPTFTTPKGIAIFPKLNTPETEVNGKALETPRYKVTLRVKESDKGVSELLAALDNLHDEAVQAATAEFKKNPKNKTKDIGKINPVYSAALTKEGDQIEGEFDITFKTQAVDKDGNEKKVRMFDAKGKPTEAKVGSGSVLKVNFSTKGYGPGPLGTGLSLYLNAVQVIELKEWSGGDASSYGFGEEEGYDSSATTEDAPFTPAEEEPAAEEPKQEQPAPKTPRKRGNF